MHFWQEYCKSDAMSSSGHFVRRHVTSACPALRPDRPALTIWVKRITPPVSPVAAGTHGQPSSHPPRPSVSWGCRVEEPQAGRLQAVEVHPASVWGCRRAGFSGGSAGVCPCLSPSSWGLQCCSCITLSPPAVFPLSLRVCFSLHKDASRIRTPVVG